MMALLYILGFLVVYFVVFLINYKLMSIGNQLSPEDATSQDETIGFSLLFIPGTIIILICLTAVISTKICNSRNINIEFKEWLKKVENWPPNFNKKD